MMGLAEKIDEAAGVIRSRWDKSPNIGLILGTGLGGLAEQIVDSVKIPYGEIPNFPVSTVESHAGQLVCGDLSGIPTVAMEGRFHYYEGYSMQEVTFPVRVMKALGADTLIITNAAGSMNHQLSLAQIVIIEDQINLMGDNPLRGINDDNLGPRFPDMSEPFSKELIQLAQQSGLELGLDCQKGVFVAVSGPNLETRAEYRMLRGMGADVVGMSTVPETIVANHAGMRVLGFSVVTDMCLPDTLEAADVQTIIKVAGEGGAKLAQLIPHVVAKLK